MNYYCIKSFESTMNTACHKEYIIYSETFGDALVKLYKFLNIPIEQGGLNGLASNGVDIYKVERMDATFIE